MASSLSLGGSSRCGRVLGPSLDKIVKNAAWRKHSHIVSTCKSALDKLESISDSTSDPNSQSPLFGFSPSDAESVLQPLILAFDSAYAKVVEPALECAFKLFSLGLIRGEIDGNSAVNVVLYKLIEGVCKVCGIGDEAVELAVLRVLLAAVRSSCVLIRGECLVQLVRTCYNVYLSGTNGTNQICAKSVLAQIMLIVYARVEEDSMDVNVKTVTVSELLEFTDKNLNEGSSISYCQNFIYEVMGASEGVHDVKFFLQSSSFTQNGSSEVPGHEGEAKVSNGNDKGELVNGEANDGNDSPVAALRWASKIREDGFLLFRNLCKLSMKYSSQESPDDQILLRGKILSLELLKVVMENGGSVWQNNERFLNAVKQYLCLSLLKNSALSVMAIFQLQCSIFMIFLSKFRSGLTAEIGIFFPMLILRILENVNQPSFLQKMIVLNFLEKIAQDSQIIVDVFVNYDCDVDAPNIYERYWSYMKGIGHMQKSENSFDPHIHFA